MIVVPASLKTEIQKQTKRHLIARCRIDYSDANIDSTIIAWAGTTQDHTYLSQVYNGKEDVTRKYITLDGYATLDGTWYPCPETEAEQDRDEIGWHGLEYSKPDGTFQDAQDGHYLYDERLHDENLYGEFVSPPELSVNFLERTVSDIRISFDNSRMEYAVDFDVILFDIAGAELYRLNVVGNSGLKYVRSIAAVNLVCQMTIRIYKWSAAGTNAKIAEIYTSISELYNGSDIMNLQVIENRELSDDGIPLGTTASGQCVLQLYNRIRKFDYDNTTSRLYNVIRKGVRILPEIGDGVNWIPLGTFYADSWDIPRGDIVVTVTGLDRMAILGESEYKTNVIIQAPADENFLTDTTAEWASGTGIGITVGSNTIRMTM